MKRILVIFLLPFAFLFLFSKEAQAEAEFLLSYDNVYDVQDDGNTHVTQRITLTNKTVGFYVTDFNLSIGKTKISNTQAQNSSGPLETRENQNGETANINVKFKEKVVGKDKGFDFTLSYDAPELAEKSGLVWEIRIPKLSSDKDISNYNVTLLVPQNFGPLAAIAPEPQEKKESEKLGFAASKKTYLFNKNQLIRSGISASFGEKQIYKFTLKYHLRNSAQTYAQAEIALPPDNAYQKVTIEAIDHKPQDVRVDKDGNWLARYILSGRSNLDVIASGFVEVYPRSQVIKKESKEDLSSYLIPQEYWEIDNLFIKEKAKELKNVREIYSFVVNYLEYNKERLNSSQVVRQGAYLAYQNPKNSVCMEFTDLFVTLARAANIPAREINGYAFSQNEKLRPLSLRFDSKDILHAWPEYYDSSLGWIQVDPTWENTSGGVDFFSKLDFNHITFVHKGLSSIQPLPAGAYKIDPEKDGDVKVELAQELPATRKNLKLKLDLPKTAFLGFPISGNVILSNQGNQSQEALKIEVRASGAWQLSKEVEDSGILPPFAKRSIPINFHLKNIFSSENVEVKVKANGLEESAQILVSPVFVLVFLIALPVFILLLLTSLVIIFFIRHLRAKQLKST